jgi:type IV pilus assembly protein PilV
MNPLIPLSHKPGQAGFSLIEVLVALLILSIGVVGVAGVQLSSIKFNQVSQQRSIASQHAISIAERMRANLTAVRPPANDYIFNFPYASIPAERAKLAAISCTTASPCTATQVAKRNLREWLDQLDASLPNGRGTITQNPPPLGVTPVGRPYVVTVMWEEKELDSGAGGFLRSTASCVDRDAPATAQCIRLEFQP